MDQQIVTLRDITVRKPAALILRSIDLDLGSGSSTALFGANGTGKTTLLRLIATLLRPSAGSGTVLGAALGTPDVESVRPQIGLVGHEPALYPNLTLRENLQLSAAVANRPASTIDEALDAVGLSGAAHRQARRSSNGMRRRTEFARLLIIEPHLLLLDEAHVGLDPAAWSLVDHLIGVTKQRGGSALIVAHEEQMVRPLVDQAVRLADGELETA